MLINNGYNKYKENSIKTASPEELTLMLYNGLVKFLMQAQAAIDEKNIEKANNSLIRAKSIVKEFQITLNMDYEVSGSLNSIYTYMYKRIVEANVKKDRIIVDEVLGYAKDLRDTWAQAMKIAKHPVSVTERITK